MRLMIIANGRLLSNGSASIAVMCGLVEASLAKGWDITYLALVSSEVPEPWEIPYNFRDRCHTLRQVNVVHAPREVGRWTRFIGSFWHAVARNVTINPSAQAALDEPYDLAIAFDSIAIPMMRHVTAHKKICIIGDPAGRRLWHSTPWSKPVLKSKALLLDVAEMAVYRTIPKDMTLAMFGSGHAAHWSRLLQRKVLDLRPFLALSVVTLPEHEPEKPIISFGGTLGNTASRQSLRLIVDGLLPALRTRFGRGGFVLRLVGEAPPLYTQMVEQFEEIELTGRVASFEQELARGELFILPMNYPVGVRTRVCAALAAGNICLVHPTVLYNMPELSKCVAVYPVRSPQDYIDVIARLPSGEERLHLRREAIAFFDRHYAAAAAVVALFNE